MQRQVFQSISEVDNSLFASTIARSGPRDWHWIVSDAHSQFDVPNGTNACSFACLKFAELVLQRAGTNGSHSDTDLARLLTDILGHRFFGDVLAVCAIAPEDGPSIELAFENSSFDWARDLTPILYGTPRPFSRAHIAALTAALEAIGLPTALTLTWAGHHRVCVYIPQDNPHSVPLFLVFDSAERFGHGASIVVHTSRGATTEHLITTYGSGVDIGGDEPPNVSADFFVSTATMGAHRPRVHAASIVLALKFGVNRAFQDVAASLPTAASAEPAPNATQPAPDPVVRSSAQVQHRAAPSALVGMTIDAHQDRSAQIAAQEERDARDLQVAWDLQYTLNPSNAATDMPRPRAPFQTQTRPAPSAPLNTTANAHFARAPPSQNPPPQYASGYPTPPELTGPLRRPSSQSSVQDSRHDHSPSSAASIPAMARPTTTFRPQPAPSVPANATTDRRRARTPAPLYTPPQKAYLTPESISSSVRHGSTERVARRLLSEQKQREYLRITGELDRAGELDRYAEVGLERPFQNWTPRYAGVV